ncbi:site-specific DNA-methyltransferase [Sphingomonas montanisoli]|nr:DNA methyltransferase [Sphingomonas montanisoli]
MTPLQIIYRQPQMLSEHGRNARRHSTKQIDRLKSSIRSFGFNAPVVINEQGEILAGHGRVRAAIELKLGEIPTVTLNHLSPAQARAFMLADNRIAELSTWDEALLAEELEELSATDEPFEITDTGFELARIDVLIEERHKPKSDADPADAPVDPGAVETVSRPGDLWLLGKHRLLVGNALDPLSYRVLLGEERAQMVFIDSPYNVPIDGHVSGKGKVRHSEFVMGSGEMSDTEFEAFLRTTFERLIDASIDGAIHYSCMDWRGLSAMLSAGSIYSELKNICCWVKSQGGMGSLYRSQHELIAVFKSGTAPHINNVALGKHGRNRTNVWAMPGMNSFQRGRAAKLAMHPTVKPVALVADAMLDCSHRGGLVLDVFSGSGTTMIAAERTGRIAAAMELDPHYADVSLRRFCDVTGIEPVNAWTGQIVRRREPTGGGR